MTVMDTIKAAASEARSLTPVPQFPDSDRGPHDRIRNRMVREVEAMTLFALATGIGVPSDLMAQLDRSMADTAADEPANSPLTDPAVRIALLSSTHAELTRLIAPARPGSLLLLIEDRRTNPFWNGFGAVPLVRRMLGVAVVSLIVLLGTALSSQVNAENMSKGLLGLQGWPLLWNEVFLFAASAVGAGLANLRRLDRFISNCTYDQRFDSSYWSRLVMGVISGILLAQVLYSAIFGGNANATADGFSALNQPILALLGGFSADLVHDVLSHFIATIGNLLGTKRAERPPSPVGGTERPPG
jgi:hypothetical protein